MELKIPPINDLVGRKFGRWTVLSFTGRNKHNQKIWECECSCPRKTKRIIRGSSLTGGYASGCGCVHLEAITKHGDASHYTRTPEYRSWECMKSRCSNQHDISYPNYGGIGISVCKEWQDSFESFLASVGRKPTKSHTIDRINSLGDYEPSNVRWANKRDQANNKRNNKIITLNGKSLSYAQWERELGFRRGTIKQRISFGWSAESTLNTPIRKYA